MKHLFVGTVLHPSANWQQLYELQTRFLSQTTTDYTLVIASEQQPDFVDGLWLQKPHISSNASMSHLYGIYALYKYFILQKDSDFLILDSDAFPIQKGWRSYLTKLMLLHQKKYAAPIRYENLDVFPHPCALFILGEALQSIGRHLLQPTQTTTPRKFTVYKRLDVGHALPLDSLFPLLRSNKYNLHPLRYGIYYDIFYHHVGGSHNGKLNSDLYWNTSSVQTEYSEQIFTHPDEFIAKLQGKTL